MGQIALKYGMASASVQEALITGGFVPVSTAIVINPFVLGGLSVDGDRLLCGAGADGDFLGAID